MKSWLTRMNSLQSFLYVATLQWNLYSSNMFNSMVVYTPNDQCSDIVHGFDKNDLQHADFVKINEIIEYNILSILWKGFVTLPNQ